MKNLTEEQLEPYREEAEKLADSLYKPHRFGDTPAWFRACVDLSQRFLYQQNTLNQIEDIIVNQYAKDDEPFSSAELRDILDNIVAVIDKKNAPGV